MANDTDLIGSFIWSKTHKNLSNFLKDYQLPQIVRVVDGFCGKNENTTISSEQILALHEIHSVRKLLGTDSSDTKVTIALSCPTQVLVCPSKCKYKSCSVENFKSIFPKVQYVRVKSCGPRSKNANNESTFKVGDIIQIQNIDRKKKSVLCQNTDTKGDMTLSYNSPAIFTPLLDCQKYTLSEVVTNYGLPSRVCFVSTGSQADQNSDQWNSALTGLTEVVFHNEVTEVKVIATIVGGGVGELTHCIGLPTNLPISCAVAERFTKNGESYENFVQTLHAGFDNKNLSERVNVFQEISRVKIYDSSNNITTVSRPQPDTLPSLVRSTRPRNQPHVSPDPDLILNEQLSEVHSDYVIPMISPNLKSQTQEYADPDLILNEQLSEVHSDYVIPMISPNVKPQTQEFADPDLILNEQLSEVHSDYVIPMISPNLKSQTQEYADPDLILNEQLSEVHSDYVIPMISPNVKPQTQEFADPGLTLNEQLSEVHSDYVIPMISPNVKPQTRKFVEHKRTDARNKSTDSHENVECKMDMKHVYEEVNPKLEWDSDFGKFKRSANCKLQTALNLKSGKSSEMKFAAIITTNDNYDLRSIQILAKYV